MVRTQACTAMAQVQALVRELRSGKLHSAPKNIQSLLYNVIYSYCSSLQRKLLLTIFSSCKTFGWPWGRVSAGEVKRSHHNAPSPKAAAGGGMRTAAGAWGWAGAGCQLLLIAGVTLLPIIYFVRMRLH